MFKEHFKKYKVKNADFSDVYNLSVDDSEVNKKVHVHTYVNNEKIMQKLVLFAVFKINCT